MAEYPGGWAVRQWHWREPLPKQWAETSDAFRDRVLKFWITASESDPWTFDQLKILHADLTTQNDEAPAALEEWRLEVEAGQRRIKRGRKRDPQGDLRALMAVTFSKEFFGWSERRACREVSKMLWRQSSPDGKPKGKKIYRSWQAVASAVGRTKRRSSD